MLYALAITLAITLDGFTPVHATLEVNPTFLVSAQFPAPHTGMALPHLIIVDLPALTRLDSFTGFHAPPAGGWENPHGNTITSLKDLAIQEEYLHTRQFSALGPAFYLVYALTLGEALEPYSPRNRPEGNSNLSDFSSMWQPSNEQARACPLLRFEWGGGTGSGSFLPCYELIRLTTGR
jgi:hypothetical protein